MARSGPARDWAISFRPAYEGDYDFLSALHVASMREHVTRIWGWDAQLQSELYRSHFDPVHIQIIIHETMPIGMLSLEERDQDLYLRQIEILPEFQRAGIGARIIDDIIHQARRSRKSVSLRVLRHNRARNLYERLGFIVVEETDTHTYMRTADPDEEGKDSSID